MIAAAAICLDRVELRPIIGVHEREKAAPQRFLVSVRVEVDPAAATPDSFFDYDPLKAFLDGLNGQRIETQEEVAARIWAFLEPDPRVKSARLSLRKPDIFENVEGAGIDVVFARAAADEAGAG